ncbi:MAG: ABC transporter ATP-binding protein [Ruminococcaceae bacterium]|nr:ABC transporter ATP-binding protein [Oscillospiraceae bacterium]
MGPGMPPFERRGNEPKIETPKSLKDIPRFLSELIGGFFKRLGYIFKMVWETGHWIFVCLMLAAILSGIIPVISSVISKEILNLLQKYYLAPIKTTFFVAVGYLIVFMFAFQIMQDLASRLNSFVTRIAGEKVVRYVKLQIMNKAKEIDLAAFDMPEFYEKLENANREAGHRPIQVINQTLSIFSGLIKLVSYTLILVSAPDMWWMVLVMAAVSVPKAIINFGYRRKTFRYIRRRSKERRQMNYYSDLLVNKDMVKEIRMFDLGDEFTKRYDAAFGIYYKGMRSLIVRENLWHITMTVVSTVATCVLYLIIAKKVFVGQMMIGDYSLYTGALMAVSASVVALIEHSAQIYEGTLFIDNLTSFIEEKPTVVPIGERPQKVEHGVPHTIEFQNVSFAYPGQDKLVLKNISLKFRPGETVVLVGLNGAGKTTFIKLLTRLYDPTDGRILLDGKDIREYDTRTLYDMFGIIFQDFGKYAASVKDNIRFGDLARELKDDSEIIAAAKQANAEDFIDRMPEGYDTPLMRYFEQEGTEPSIGQWQKLAIARAFYSNSDILILDEPTASLDPIAEQEIFNQFDELRKDKTTIFVSHRLSSATIASKIVVLEYGELVEEGTHRELMELQGRYYELFTTQASRYIEGNEPSPEDKT